VTEQIEQAKAAQSEFRTAIQETELSEIPQNQDLLNFALAGGRAAFANNCSQCHGRGAQGFVGYPNLNDDDWIWGGSLDAIHETIKYGIRNADENSRQSEMPAFGNDELLEPQQINDVAEYVLSFQNRATDQEAAKRGEEIYAENCAACHMEDGAGMAELGAPKLSDAIWLFGGDKADIVKSIQTGRGGVMPPWHTRLDEVTVKQLAVYVHSLGGGR
jgi:cytochrome c oxidase cbb3-type subunit 3